MRFRKRTLAGTEPPKKTCNRCRLRFAQNELARYSGGGGQLSWEICASCEAAICDQYGMPHDAIADIAFVRGMVRDMEYRAIQEARRSPHVSRVVADQVARNKVQVGSLRGVLHTAMRPLVAQYRADLESMERGEITPVEVGNRLARGAEALAREFGLFRSDESIPIEQEAF